MDSKQRQLRLVAFAVFNKMSQHFPHLKVAGVKRAYRKTPYYGYCPSPEAKFHAASHEQSAKAEEILHYFHGCHKAAVAEVGDDYTQQAFLANVDVAVAEAFIQHVDKTSNKADFQKRLMEATVKYYQQLCGISYAVRERMEAAVADERLKWIAFKELPAAPAKGPNSQLRSGGTN